jgi:hypothetical protein
MTIPDHFSESFETDFWVKNRYQLPCTLLHKFFDEDPAPESGIFLTLDQGWKNWNLIFDNKPLDPNWIPIRIHLKC